MSNKKILLTAFRNGVSAHGGVRRSQQISEYAAGMGYEIAYPESVGSAGWIALQHPLCTLKALMLVFSIGISNFTLRGIIGSVLHGSWLINILSKDNYAELLIEAAPNRAIVLAALLGAMKRKYTVLPHNIEFLVPGRSQSYFRNKSNEFYVENYAYLKADKVVAISEFDAAIVRCLGVKNANVLQYQPIKKIKDDLLEIQKLRKKNKNKRKYLILGTISNAPTRAGMMEIIKEIKAGQAGNEFIVAGYGTETFKQYASDNIEVVGSISNEKLYELLGCCKALVIKQSQTSGMLTRIIEAEIAGIPTFILGDYIQSKSTELKKCTLINDIKCLPKEDLN